MKSALDILAEAIDPHQPQALLVGGQALSAYNVVRQTLDVDCVVAESALRFLDQVLRKAGYEMAARSSAVVRYRHRSPLLMDVDLLTVDEATFAEMLAASQVWKHGPTTWRVPSVPHLIAMKLHAMKYNPDRLGRDLGDVLSLLRANPGRVTPDELQRLCNRYGPEGIFEQIERLAK